MSNELEVRSQEMAVRQEGTVEELVARAELVKKAMSLAMKRDEHFGTIPGAAKPSLFKPGAEKLATLFRLRPEYEHERERDGDHLTVTSKCTLVHIPTGDVLVKGAAGSCSTRESRYAYRQAKRRCPICKTEAIFKSKLEPGWYCWAKEGGCGHKFGQDDPEITDQIVGRVANPDLPDLWNTIVKMADKRAFVGAILAATAASDVFTQDVEDLAPTEPQAGAAAPGEAAAAHGSAERATPKQAGFLAKLLDERNIPHSEFTRRYKVATLAELPKAAFLGDDGLIAQVQKMPKRAADQKVVSERVPEPALTPEDAERDRRWADNAAS